MIRFTHLFFLLLLLIAAPLLAQSKAPPAPQSDQVAQIKAQDAKIEALTTAADEARYEKNIAEIKAEVLQSQTSWFEILTSAMIGLFGVLITAVVIYFVFKFDSDARTKIEQAVKDSARLTNDAVQKLTAETGVALASAKQLLEEAKAAVADIHVERETARELLEAMNADVPIDIHAGLDEYHGEALYAAHTGGRNALDHQRGDYRDYWRTMKAAMHAWAAGDLADVPESWTQFGERTRAALTMAASGLKRDDCALIVSSGGAISRTMVEILGAPGTIGVEFNLQFRNAGFCELIVAGDAPRQEYRLVAFNAIPHLDTPERRAAITFA